MPIKNPEPISRADFDEAVVRLRLNIAEVAKETGIPRAYLSEFRNGDRRLRPEQAMKLRDFFEGRGVEFEDTADQEHEQERQPKRIRQVADHPSLRAETQMRQAFALADGLAPEKVTRAVDAMDENDARLVVLLRKVTQKETGILGGETDEYTEESKADLQEAIGLLAANYVIFRTLRGWPAFGKALKGGSDPAELASVLVGCFREPLEQAGLIESQEDGDQDQQGDE